MPFSRLTALYAKKCEWSNLTEPFRPSGSAWTADGGFPGRLTAGSDGIVFTPGRVGTRRGLAAAHLAWSDVRELSSESTWRVGALLAIRTTDGGKVVFGLSRGGRNAEDALAELAAARAGGV